MDKIDIMIPTYNRPDFLKRILDYYQPFYKDFNFIIADSSLPMNKKSNKKLVKNYSDMNILYIDKFSEKLQPHLKFIEMVKYIKTEFCVLCADDDFIVPVAIKECVKFLKKNPDYSAAHGTYIGFHVIKTFWQNKIFCWKYRYSPNSLTYSKALDRVNFHLRNYMMVIFAVRRSSVVKKIYKEFSKTNIDPYLLPEFGEILPDVLTVIYGKIKRINTFYGARQYFGSINSYFPSIKQSRKVGIYDREYSKFEKCIINNLKKKENISHDNSALILSKAMDAYIKFSYQEHITNKIKLFLLPYPKFILRGLRLFHAIYLFSKEKRDRIGIVSNPSSKYYKDFMTIYKLIMQ